MKQFLLCALSLLILSAAAFANSIDVSIALNPSIEVYPPSYDPAQCELAGTAPCVVFSGTITDKDMDGSPLSLTGVTISDATYFTVDNTFSNDTPGLYEGDTLNSYASNSYGPGPIFGLDFAANIPAGTYMLDAIFSGAGGTNDPNDNGFTVTVPFTVVIVPEPETWGLMITGLLVIAASWRRRAHLC